MRKARKGSLLDNRFKCGVYVRRRRQSSSPTSRIPKKATDQSLFEFRVVLPSFELRRAANQRAWDSKLLPYSLSLRYLWFGTVFSSTNVFRSSMAISVWVWPEPVTSSTCVTSNGRSWIRWKLSKLPAVRKRRWVHQSINEKYLVPHILFSNENISQKC